MTDTEKEAAARRIAELERKLSDASWALKQQQEMYERHIAEMSKAVQSVGEKIMEDFVTLNLVA